MFNTIQNPKTGRWVKTTGQIGKEILANYSEQLGGGHRGQPTHWQRKQRERRENAAVHRKNMGNPKRTGTAPGWSRELNNSIGKKKNSRKCKLPHIHKPKNSQERPKGRRSSRARRKLPDIINEQANEWNKQANKWNEQANERNKQENKWLAKLSAAKNRARERMNCKAAEAAEQRHRQDIIDQLNNYWAEEDANKRRNKRRRKMEERKRVEKQMRAIEWLGHSANPRMRCKTKSRDINEECPYNEFLNAYYKT
tara:strand:- start:2697 stop:3458 length:762 start_codon:yes stop_codon:yes gene_type:complete